MWSIRWDFGRLNINLRRLSERTQRGILREGLRDAAEPMRKRMSQLAPVFQEPSTRKHLKHKVHIGNARGEDFQEVAIAVGPITAGFYGSWSELGSSRQAAQPFARPAFDETHMQSLRIFADTLWRELKRRVTGGKVVTTAQIDLGPLVGGPGGGGLT